MSTVSRQASGGGRSESTVIFWYPRYSAAKKTYCTVSRGGAGSNGHNGHFLGQPTRPWVGTPRGVTQVRWAYPTDFSWCLATGDGDVGVDGGSEVPRPSRLRAGNY